MKSLNIYQQLQFAIIIVLFFAWVTTGVINVIVPEPTEFVVTLYGKLEAIFFTLVSMKTLEAAISRANGGPDASVDNKETV